MPQTSSMPNLSSGDSFGSLRIGIRSHTSILFCMLLVLLSSPVQASVSAQVDRNTISEGDTFTLTLTVSGNNQAQPDLSALRKNFDVLGTGQKNMIQIINGNMTSNRSWTITLSPRQTGKLRIPSVTVGNDRSNALTVNVLPATASSNPGARQAEVFLEVNVKPQQHTYVQAQLIYTVRLYTAETLRQGTLSEPSLNNAIVQKLGKDSNYQTVRGGRQYQVIERRYAIFPQHSGKLEIPAVVFDGKVDDPSAQTGDPFFDSFNPATRQVHLRSRKLELQIAAQPAGYQGANWLPAQKLALQEKWSPARPSFRVGEPVTRDIIISARGLSASQLPDLNQPAVDGLKLYPDQAQTSDKPAGDTLESRREQKIAMIPTRAGELTLPAINLTWWDTRARQQRSAKLPAETIRVLPAAGGINTDTRPSATKANPANAATRPSAQNTALPAPVTAMPGRAIGRTRLWMLVSLLLALAWLVTLLFWWRTAHKHRQQPARQQLAQATPLRPAVKLLRLACRQNNPAAVQHALLSWARVYWRQNPPLSLGALAAVVADEGFAREIRNLDKCLYTGTISDWQAAPLLQGFDGFCKQQHAAANEAESEHALEPLYLKQAAGHR